MGTRAKSASHDATRKTHQGAALTGAATQPLEISAQRSPAPPPSAASVAITVEMAEAPPAWEGTSIGWAKRGGGSALATVIVRTL